MIYYQICGIDFNKRYISIYFINGSCNQFTSLSINSYRIIGIIA